MKDEARYVLELTSDQMCAVERACEMFARMRIGQVRFLDLDMCRKLDGEKTDEYLKRLDKVRDSIQILEKQAFPNGEMSLHKDQLAETAWNVYQATRYAHAWDEHPEGGITVDFDRPIDVSGIGIPKCYVKE